MIGWDGADGRVEWWEDEQTKLEHGDHRMHSARDKIIDEDFLSHQSFRSKMIGKDRNASRRWVLNAISAGLTVE